MYVYQGYLCVCVLQAYNPSTLTDVCANKCTCMCLYPFYLKLNVKFKHFRYLCTTMYISIRVYFFVLKNAGIKLFFIDYTK